MDRLYTVKEIDELRKVCKNRLIYGSSVASKWSWVDNGKGIKILIPQRWPYKRDELEDLVRTCMLEGVTADDIHCSDVEEGTHKPTQLKKENMISISREAYARCLRARDILEKITAQVNNHTGESVYMTVIDSLILGIAEKLVSEWKVKDTL